MLVPRITSLLNRCLTAKQLKQLHGLMLIHGVNHLEGMVIRHLINSRSNYSQSIAHYLQLILCNSKQPDVFSTTLAIRYFCNNGGFQEAFNQYVQLQKSGFLPSTFTVASALKACGRLGDENGGIMVHCQVHSYGFCGDVYVETALVGFYTKLGDMETAKKVFDEMSERNVVSWNSMIDGYLRSGKLSKAEGFFSGMPDKDVVSWNSMVSGYSRIGDMENALRLFQEMPERNPTSWNAMISGYVECGKIDSARNFYNSMPERNTISCITMIGGYSKCGDVESACGLFREMGKKDHLLYNAMIACYGKNSRPKEALQLFDEMLQPNVNIQPDKMTLATVISACSQLGDLGFGSWIEDSYMKQTGIPMDDHLRTALIDLYAKCGSIDKAFKLFHELHKKDVVAYTAMILGCGINGKEQIAIKLFDEMLESKIIPNLVTFSGILTALSHVGMVEESYRCFNSMKRYGLVATPDHYSLMVEILGRAGQLEEAHDLIKSMPMEPHAGVWGALLLACSTHNNVELGEIAARHCFQLEADSIGYGSLLANIYASVGRWDDAKRLRTCVREKGLVKVPGSSWMDHVQEFKNQTKRIQ
ncbi:pentatricopeptide repeat-containing protein At4g22760 [Cynara cardunculus var. scolymus]|uniref:pentatricopeptide repeat-containing protein At4g22760 n=1 Tax=Cynara cardunculus var. scolymus TaxID=59895 RepID=UPI000D62E836|nr:pentatricopeptide repeat-containing protein At4g22760 [Cynara cardunculus var. scolymus]